MNTPPSLEKIAGLVLAGGRSLRFGGKAKAFQMLGGAPLILHALRPLRGLSHVAINANRDKAALAELGSPVIPDLVPETGPLGGIHAGLAWAAALTPKAEWLATVPIDTPFLPADLVAILAGARNGAVVIVAATAEDFSPVCALWRTDLLTHLKAALERGMRKMTDYLDEVAWCKVNIGGTPIDPLFNINTAEKLAEAEALIRAPGPGSHRTPGQ